MTFKTSKLESIVRFTRKKIADFFMSFARFSEAEFTYKALLNTM